MSQTPLFDFDLMPERHVWKVSELTERLRDLLEAEFPDVWIEGEVSNYHAAQSGHLYFTLKDARSQIRCVCFRDQARGLKFRPEDGLHITVRGSLGVYDAAWRVSGLRQPHRAGRPRRAATCLRAIEEESSRPKGSSTKHGRSLCRCCRAASAWSRRPRARPFATSCASSSGASRTSTYRSIR